MRCCPGCEIAKAQRHIEAVVASPLNADPPVTRESLAAKRRDLEGLMARFGDAPSSDSGGTDHA